MNTKLLATLRKGMTEPNRQEMLVQVAETQASDNELIVELTDVELTKMVNLAAYYLARATNHIFKSDPTFENGYNMSAINQGMAELMKNPAILNYSQALMILTVALLTERVYVTNSQ